jgi:choline dehydrogenase
LKDPKVNWLYETEPDPGTGGRSHVWPRGKVLGGSSSINGLIYIRGQHADYDGWRQLGCEGWGWDDVFAYFRRAQHQERGADAWHATGGPLNVSDPRDTHEVSDAVVEACMQADCRSATSMARIRGGVLVSADGEERAAVFSGSRLSASGDGRAIFKWKRARSPTRVLFEGARVGGVSAERANAHRQRTKKSDPSGGAVNSPQLFAAGHRIRRTLRSMGSRSADLPGVGENLRDHYVMSMQYRLRPDVISVNELTRACALSARHKMHATQGLLTLSAAHIAAFCKSRPSLPVG